MNILVKEIREMLEHSEIYNIFGKYEELENLVRKNKSFAIQNQELFFEDTMDLIYRRSDEERIFAVFKCIKAMLKYSSGFCFMTASYSFEQKLLHYLHGDDVDAILNFFSLLKSFVKYLERPLNIQVDSIIQSLLFLDQNKAAPIDFIYNWIKTIHLEEYQVNQILGILQNSLERHDKYTNYYAMLSFSNLLSRYDIDELQYKYVIYSLVTEILCDYRKEALEALGILGNKFAFDELPINELFEINDIGEDDEKQSVMECLAMILDGRKNKIQTEFVEKVILKNVFDIENKLLGFKKSFVGLVQSYLEFDIEAEDFIFANERLNELFYKDDSIKFDSLIDDEDVS